MDFKELDNLWGDNPQDNHKYCTGCSILKRPGDHGIDDYSEFNECVVDALFLAGSYSNTIAGPVAFRDEEAKIISEILNHFKRDNLRLQVSVAVKCPNIKETDITKIEDRNICRKHVEATIDKFKPKLVFVCGELAYLMLFKKKGCGKNRGVTLEYETPNLTKTKIIPLFHPWQVVMEPRNKYLFQLDIVTGINQVVLNKVPTSDFEFEFIDTIEKATILDALSNISQDIAIDIETTGLDFLKDKMNTTAFSYRMEDNKIKNICIPIEHKDSPFNKQQLEIIFGYIDKILSNPKNRKIFQKGQFDMKFFHRYGIKKIVNVWDTKLMQHLVNESIPKSLKDLVKYYFPLDNIN